MRWYKFSFERAALDRGDAIRFVETYVNCLMRSSSAGRFLLFRPVNEPPETATYFLAPDAVSLCPQIISGFVFEVVDSPSPREVELVVGTKGAAKIWLGTDEIALAAGSH